MNEVPCFPFSAAPSRLVERFVRLMVEEVPWRRQRQLDEFFLLFKYESELFSREGRLNQVGVRAYAARLSPLLREILRRDSPRLLDAGSGMGSEAILAALLGAEVTGMDLVPFKTDFALSRVPFFQEACRRPLRLQFRTAHVIRHLQESPGYDILWANEAVSHIHPAEDFFKAAYRGLRPGGVLIIADANALNPVARWRASRIRGGRNWYVHRQTVPQCAAPLDEVAEERLFSSLALPRMLRKEGFRVRRLDMHGFLGSFFLPRAWQFIPLVGRAAACFQNAARRLPGIRRLGSSMTVIAEKGGGS